MKVRDYFLGALNALAKDVHASAKRRSFYDDDKIARFDGQLMNVVGEVAEAQEEWRHGRDFQETYWTWPEIIGSAGAEYWLKIEGGKTWIRNYDWDFNSQENKWLEMTPERLRGMPNMIEHMKPEGIPSELADIIIRVLDLCGYYEIDIANAIADKMAYNDTRQKMHGGKRS